MAHSAEALAALDGAVEPVVVACQGRIRPEQIDLLTSLERERPWVPVVLVADPDHELTRQLLRVRTAAVVWFTELDTHLRRRLDAVRATWGLWGLAGVFERSSLPPALRKALVHAVQRAADRPVRNVRELAGGVGCAPVTLFRQFGARANDATTLSAFIAGLSVLRMYELRRSGLNWKLVVGHVRLGRATITRRIKAWPGCLPGEHERLPPDRLFGAFTAEHVRPILQAASDEVSTLDQ
ncbi:MAG: hypothetical protein OXI39_09140 [Gemmatimonadota bacterium]|uniref:hypothetical protein n=1 Tax=Candidatus Palauibacter scopulicola TaxID=3056741 RepID=UPI00238F808C|nr:hypothetical protein [Candidatus Palauibacter scopulicola]MDE2663151.1 hypothetical protein [Candidatus Palauibacter scopulicola]